MISTDRRSIGVETSTGNGGPWPARVGHIARWWGSGLRGVRPPTPERPSVPPPRVHRIVSFVTVRRLPGNHHEYT